jgi:integrase
LIGLRDRALIGVMVYTFARVGAAVAMRVGDYFEHRNRLWLRLHEKGGKHYPTKACPLRTRQTARNCTREFRSSNFCVRRALL